jgi:hypothetical protein
MARIIVRILVSEESEIKFVIMNAIESRGLVDRILVVEHDFSHTGMKSEYKFGNHLRDIRLLSDNPKVELHQITIENEVVKDAKSSEEMHFNEQLIRKSFLNSCQIEDRDLIVALDADEILYRKTYRMIKIIKMFTPFFSLCHSLQLHQFFYKMNYLWKDVKFRSPVLVTATIAKQNPQKLRDSGKRIPFFAGCHFSWQLSVPGMIRKIKNYAHNPEYLHLAREEILSKAIEEKRYPFDPNRPFNIKVLNDSQLSRVVPNSFYQVNYLFEESSRGEI